MAECRPNEQGVLGPPREEQGSTWSDSNLFGLGGPNQQRMVGEYHLDDWPRALVTLTLGLLRGEPNPLAPTPTFGPIYADIKLGYGASSYTFSMDWANGASIRVPGGTVTVYARQADVLDYRVSLTASLSMGTRGGSIPPTLTQYFAVPKLPGAQIIDVPPRARGLVVPKVFSAAPSDFQITVLRAVGLNSIAVYNHAIASDSAIWTTGVVLPGAAAQIQIQSAIGLLPNAANAIFLLDG
jgi:hypothetical protein